MDGVEEAVSNMRSLKRFRDRDPHCKLTYGVKKLCRAFLEKVSGGDEVAMMKDVLCKGTLFQELSPSLVKFINSSPDDVRRGVIAALRKDGWSQSTVKQAGITAGDDIFKTSVAGAGEQGRPTIQTPQLRRSIKEAHEEHATTTSRTLKAGCLSGLEKKEKLISNVNRRLLQPPKRGRKPKATLESSSDGASSEEEPQSAPPEPPASAQPGRPVTPRTRGRRVVSGRKK
eukprot:TRINITY_DN1437_c0_g2_i2.p1 TRINITY_DN1437_c0_g2~~TRINITY_DN1437_c0_g2_i2.p1  ORF type:complete len:229 (+),score=20.22 TRINITY_DN1437_c0_g2_i2:233-919(+)